MSDIEIRREGRAGRITLNRPKALNALTYDMCLALEEALLGWAGDDAVALVVIDAVGEKAFCAGGDIAALYETGRAGDFDYGRRFWRDEYRMNALIAEYPKPVVSFLQGFVMGGGVGVGCHGSHRVVGETSRIAMPECGIGLVPDVGGSLLLAQAPGRMGAYLGLCAARMGPGDAELAGFADLFIPEAAWPAAKAALVAKGDPAVLADHMRHVPKSDMQGHLREIDRLFAADRLAEVFAALEAAETPFAVKTREAMARMCPLSMACTLEMLRRLGDATEIREALRLEYRFTHRAMEDGDLLEGIRAAIIDKDRNPRWSHRPDAVPEATVAAMLAPVEAEAMLFKREDRA